MHPGPTLLVGRTNARFPFVNTSLCCHIQVAFRFAPKEDASVCDDACSGKQRLRRGGRAYHFEMSESIVYPTHRGCFG